MLKGCSTAGLLAVLLVAGCGKEKQAAVAPPAAEVGVITVALRDVPLIFDFVGQTQSSQQVEIRARVNGFLEKRVYAEGALVKAGETLFLMDPKPFEATLKAAEAELAQQQARLNTARADLNRVRPLAARNALSQRDLDDATGKHQEAAAAVEQARANVINAKLNLSYTTIKSPVAGLSSFAKRQVGSYIDTTNSLLTYVAKLDPMWVNFSLSENEVLSIRSSEKSGAIKYPAQEAFDIVIVLADGSEFPHHGRIAFADASFSQETGTYLVRAEVANPQGTLRPGQFVRVKVHGAMRTQAIAVPQEAIVQGPRGQTVWVIGPDNKAQQRVVDVGEWTGSNWVVRSGLKAGERVAVSGILRLMPDAPVKPVPAAQVAAPGPASGAAAAAAPAASGAAAPRAANSTGGKP
ncbi:lipoprotein, component of acridine efflux pump, similar to acrA [Cupriavidus taiwanensis]|uniref:Lipoprotein, component of acridine efflux pump, similar to acrA n=1 Tax=Cupriavidus taiwanensis TaxID=164546 RepID=A0A375E1U9_9BURK|nr:efflux RND transporter periplasmic adaptor subunit [Cupriavidus taiwanensis]SOZ57511.1 lipoprotein, component of acridine efflux pump, similar to acrA [Cupriavidus taiwanensis]SOZ58185.1 lipoprotein, component of acridine efflux pump, similar to acrA [Cupriavidus taiwanensis]SOZ61104.1 lipoprotein, component of acridine efflux pump, similar to acrA [Cupriavidus taiwanensis]SPA05974.1 lipoprotein, component of acridine efflux pump, similar to acrA [Cupriavidus taiwanensis]